MTRSRTGLTMMAAVLVVVTAACGGSDGGDGADATSRASGTDADDSQSGDSGQTSDSVNADPGSEPSDQAGTIDIGGGVELPILGSATVSVGDVSYEFSLIQCGMFQDRFDGSGVSTADTAAEKDLLQFFIQPTGSPDIVESAQHSLTVVDLANNFEWNAGASPFLGPITFEHSMILDWSRDGMVTSGTARFVETNHAYSQDASANYPEPAPVDGIFDIDCSGAE